MKTKLSMALILALSVGVSGELAMAQNAQADSLNVPQAQYAVFHPGQDRGGLEQVSWFHRDKERCDGDHDRDDRNCRYDRDDLYRNNGYYNGYGQSNAYYGNGYYRNGWYDRSGNFHPQASNGYYDRNGNWHNNGWRDRDDR
jgi:hypothetical protein